MTHCRQVMLEELLEGRVFYLTSELKELLKAQRKAADRIQHRKGMIVRNVFFHDRPGFMKNALGPDYDVLHDIARRRW